MPHTHPVLLAEDDEDMVFFLERSFRKAGIQNPIEIARDGDAALEYLLRGWRDKAPRLVVLDIKMPGKDGFEVLRTIRSDPKLRGIPVVIFSSSREQRDVDRAYELGANSYLVKPGSSAELDDVVAKMQNYWLNFNQQSWATDRGRM